MIRSSKTSAACCVLVLGCLAASAFGQPASRSFTPDEERELKEATDLIARAMQLHREGKFREALPLAEQSLQIRQRVVSDEHLLTAVSLALLGRLAISEGNYPAARSSFERAHRIHLKLAGADHQLTASTHSALGTIFMALGNFAAARPHYERSISIYRKVYGENHPLTAGSLVELGVLLRFVGELPEARRSLEKALEIHRTALGEDHPATGAAHQGLAVVLCAQRDFKTATVHLENALRIARKHHGDQHVGTAALLDQLGFTLKEQLNFNAAQPLIEESLKIRTAVLGEDHPLTAESLYTLALLKSHRGRVYEAVPLIDQAQRVNRRNTGRWLPTLSGREQLAFLDQKLIPPFFIALNLGQRQADRFDSAMALLVKRAAATGTSEADRVKIQESLIQHREGKAVSLGRSASWVINGKGMVHEALALQALRGREVDDPAANAASRELLEIRRQLAALSLSIAEPSAAAARNERLRELAANEEELIRKLAAAGQLPASTGSWLETDQIRAALRNDEVLIDIVRFRWYSYTAPGSQKEKWMWNQYGAWIIPPAGQGNLEFVNLGNAVQIDPVVAAARQALQAAATDGPIAERGEAEVEKELRSKLEPAAKLVWQRIAPKIGSAKKLVISPDANLWLLPWGALPVGAERYLIEDYSIRLVNSGRDLVASSPDVPTAPAALFADPAFGLGAAQTRATLKAMFPRQTFPADTRSAHNLSEASPLPGTAAEVRAIAPNIETLTGKTPQVRAGSFALETAVKNVERPSVLVLSTHGFFLPEQETSPRTEITLASLLGLRPAVTTDDTPVENPLLRCGLLLAGCNRRQSASGDDGVLTGLEICGIDLRGTDLVVLSACDTGVGDVRNGEGVAGLRQAFQLAGARSVVATLWQIPDLESARIMNDFFAGLAEGQSKADALRNAQLKRIAARREKYGAAHPYFWAAYTLTGQ